MRQISVDIFGLPATGWLDLIEHSSELQEIVEAKPGAPSGGLGKGVRFRQARPGGEHRTQPTVGVEKHHPVLAPIESARREHEPGATLGVEGVGDLEGDRCLSVTVRGNC
jgi:hypothetical protein